MISLAFLPDVQPEIREAYRWYERQRKGLGKQFRAELKSVFARIQRMPTVFAPIHADVRCVVANRFPYVVYYRVLPDTVLVIAVLHRSRDPNVWILRI